MTGCTLSANRADEEGGGIYNGGILALIDSTLSGNGATYRGGGIYNTGNLTVTGSMLSNHGVGRRGGAIYNIGTLDVNGSAFSDNWANIDGGAIYNEGAATVTGSTLSGNEVDVRGGGIFSSGVLTVTGSTLSGNKTKLRGGGIYNWGTLTLTGSTLFGNSATAEGGGLYNESSCTLHYAYTIIAHSSSGGDCYNDGAIDLNSHNLVQDGSCAAAFSGDPLLAPLDDNGGATFTHALLPGSPAIDAIPLTACPLAADQRGASRNDWACDIGAFEVQFDDSDTASRTILSGNTYTFGPTLVQIQVNGDGGCLTGLTIQRIETHHPNATDGIKTGRYWDITPIPADCTGGLSLTVTLPLSVSPTGRDKACRYTGAGWECGPDADNSGSAAGPGAISNLVIRQNVTQLSEWAVGSNVGPSAVRLARFAGRPTYLVAWLLLGLGVLAGVALVAPGSARPALPARGRAVRGKVSRNNP
jgi:hypothetical protein